VICADDERARALIPHLSKRVVTYGMRDGSDFCVRLLPRPPQAGERSPLSAFSVRYNGSSLGDFELFVPGIHNVRNAAAAVAVGTGLDVPPDVIRSALAQYSGVDRRFQFKGKANGISVVDDYGHHPTEIRATLAAARECTFRCVHVIFQPHRYSRTRDLMDEFSDCFTDCDTLQVLDIYAASEEPIAGITGENLAKRIPHARYAASFDAAIANVIDSAGDGDLVITMGAGNVSQLGPQILRALEARAAAHP
jgi:UDP-N-acetylmuramate--alanine ligase